MNFIDKAISDELTGDDFLQAMADIYSESDVREILRNYPPFISDVIMIIDYDTVLQMDGLDGIINGSLKNKCIEIIDTLERCGIDSEATVIRQAKELSDTDVGKYEKECDNLYSKLALNNDYEGFGKIMCDYIDKNLA